VIDRSSRFRDTLTGRKVEMPSALLERVLRDRATQEFDGTRLLKIAGIVDSKGRSDARRVDEMVYGIGSRTGPYRQRTADHIRRSW
jgi:hypothetical protein